MNSKREQVSSALHTSAKPTGSKFFDVRVGVKGMGSGPSPPTRPPAKAFATTFVLFAIEAGAKAEADTTESKRTMILLRDMVTRHTDKI